MDKPWGHELWWAEIDRYAGKILVVNAGQALPLQYHREKDETSYLLSGKLRLTHGPNADTLSELFATSVYTRGAMALEALRLNVGTSTMLTILRDWAGAPLRERGHRRIHGARRKGLWTLPAAPLQALALSGGKPS